MTSLKIRTGDVFVLYEDGSIWSKEVEVSEEFAERFRRNWEEFAKLQEELDSFLRIQNGK